MERARIRAAAGVVVAALWLPVLASAQAATGERAPADESVAALRSLGQAIFFDQDLSRPAGTSCASCHDPQRGFSGDNGSTVGLPRGSRPGHFARRSAPSLLYLAYVPRFRFFQEGDDPQAAPFGGFFWDGRADSIRALARQPLLNPDEMNADGATIAASIGRAPYAAAFVEAFGAGALSGQEAVLDGIGRALEAYLTAPVMAPFSSRFDAFVRGRGTLTAIEQRGLALFEDPAKGGCAACHAVVAVGGDPTQSLFTDFGYDAVGAPRNRRAPRRRDPDLGLCERRNPETPTDDPMYCVSFRTPSLRNVAVRPSFMHNGAFSNLRDVVAFYATRGTTPQRWYPSGIVFDDVPARFRGQINVTAPPYDRRPGQPAALNDDEIDAVVTFLRTLTDAAPSLN